VYITMSERQKKMKTCPHCNGKGRTSVVIWCGVCDGSGKVSESKYNDYKKRAITVLFKDEG